MKFNSIILILWALVKIPTFAQNIQDLLKTKTTKGWDG
jgi:hypothetical protein